MHLPLFRKYYADICEGSYEGAVIRFWSTLLPRYFTANDYYGVAPEDKVHDKVDDKCDITVQRLVVRLGTVARVILCECKRHAFENRPSKWEGAEKQLSNYMRLARSQDRLWQDTFFGIVAIGRWLQFFELRPDQQELNALVDTEGRQYELMRDEDEIDNILYTLHARTRLIREQPEMYYRVHVFAFAAISKLTGQ